MVSGGEGGIVPASPYGAPVIPRFWRGTAAQSAASCATRPACRWSNPVVSSTHRALSKIKNPLAGAIFILAERVGFEPTVPLRVLRFSRPVHSTTLPPLRKPDGNAKVPRGRILPVLAHRLQRSQAAHVRLQIRWNVHSPIGALVVLQHRD